MKKFEQKIKDNIFVLSISGIIIISFYHILRYNEILFNTFKDLVDVLMPFIIGFVIAFVLEPIFTFTNKHCNKKFSDKISRIISVSISMFIFVAIMVGFLLLIIPQLTDSVLSVFNVFKDNIDKIDELVVFFSETIKLNQEIIDVIISYIDQYSNSLLGSVTSLVPKIIGSSINFIALVVRILIGFIISIYIMYDRKRISGQFKKIGFAIMKKEAFDKVLDITAMSSKLFKQFIVGKIIDSLILGIICYICMNIFKFDYVLLISIIITITNVIPFFGPFIGAIPSVFILLLIDPMQAVWFSIFVLALQQFDGNILGPYILGDTMGLPVFWVMFALLVGGGYFGILGMFLGIPLFSLIYFLIKSFVYKRLEEKNIKVE